VQKRSWRRSNVNAVNITTTLCCRFANRTRRALMVPWLRIAVLAYLWAALAEDTLLFVLAWIAPDLWFRLLHAAAPAGLEIALLRRSAGQWAAFALAQAIVLWRWHRRPEWLAVAAGLRFSDLFTDVSYILAVPTLTRLGWIVLLLPPLLNLAGVVIMLSAYRHALAAVSPARLD
jgi:hypothetical protein